MLKISFYLILAIWCEHYFAVSLYTYLWTRSFFFFFFFSVARHTVIVYLSSLIWNDQIAHTCPWQILCFNGNHTNIIPLSKHLLSTWQWLSSIERWVCVSSPSNWEHPCFQWLVEDGRSGTEWLLKFSRNMQ